MKRFLARIEGYDGRNWGIELLNNQPEFDRKEKILEAGVHFFRMFFYPAAVGALNQLEVSQLIRANFE
jgi:hypothetical protein